ncbi:MAG: DUF2269 family protein [Chloroflexota bacterium]
MDWVLLILLFLHVIGAIVAFGPTFAFPFIGSMAGKEPQHLNFALRLQHRIAHGLVTPLALIQGVTGLLLVWKDGFDVLWHVWLLAGIGLYLVALAVSFMVLYPSLRVLIPATSGPPPAPPAGGAPSGPPPLIMATAARAKLGGQVNSVLIVVIVFLMVGGANGFLP